MQRSGVRSPRRPPNCYHGLSSMVLSDIDIKRYIDLGKIRISPSLPADQFGSCSVDFRLGTEFNVFEHSRYPYIDLKSKTALEGIMRSVDRGTGRAVHPTASGIRARHNRGKAGARQRRSGAAGRPFESWPDRNYRAWNGRPVRSGLERKGDAGTQQSGTNARGALSGHAHLLIYI